MTILSAMQSAAIRLIGRKPSTFFSTTNQFETEIADLVTETARDIAKSHDWQALLKLAVLNGDGSKTTFDLPPDYDRMMIKGQVHSKSWATWRFTPARDLDQLMDFKAGLSVLNPGIWTMLGGKMEFYPAPASGETPKFYYVSRNFAASTTGAPQDIFQKDTDEFLLDDRLLTLGLLWRWKAQKGMEYAELMASYEKALAEDIGRDKGSRILAVGRGRMRGDVSIAYPGTIVP